MDRDEIKERLEHGNWFVYTNVMTGIEVNITSRMTPDGEGYFISFVDLDNGERTSYTNEPMTADFVVTIMLHIAPIEDWSIA